MTSYTFTLLWEAFRNTDNKGLLIHILKELLGLYEESDTSEAKMFAEELIKLVISDPTTYIFDDVLDLAPIKALEGSKMHDLLKIFVFDKLSSFEEFDKTFLDGLALTSKDLAVKSSQVVPTIPPTTPSNTESPTTPTEMPTGGLLADKIVRMEQEFEHLVDATEESFIENHVPLTKIQRSIKHIPVSLKRDLGDYFRHEASNILNTKSIEDLFLSLSFYWDYLNPGLLEFLVGRFGTDTDIELLCKYLDKLDQFQAEVKLVEYVKVKQVEISASRYQKITAIMGPGWEQKTLQDAVRYKNELAKELNIQPFLARIYTAASSIAITVCLPPWIEVKIKKLEPFFKATEVMKVLVCHIDWTEQVSSPSIAVETKDMARNTERPSADELCRRLAILKREPRYTHSVEQSREQNMSLQTLQQELERARANHESELHQFQATFQHQVKEKDNELERAKKQICDYVKQNMSLQQLIQEKDKEMKRTKENYKTEFRECQQQLCEKDSELERARAELINLKINLVTNEVTTTEHAQPERLKLTWRQRTPAPEIMSYCWGAAVVHVTSLTIIQCIPTHNLKTSGLHYHHVNMSVLVLQ